MNTKEPIVIDLTRQHSNKPPTVEKLLLDIFGGNSYFSMAHMTGTSLSYQPVDRPLTEKLLTEHLSGKVVLGAYQLLQEDSTVNWLGWDVDAEDTTIARQYATKILTHLTDIPHVVEFSGQKGYHILVFLESPMAAAQAQQVVDFIRTAEGLPKSGKNHVEAYPKQAKLSKSLPKGSLLKLPLGKHPRSHNRSVFCDVQNGWEVSPLDPAGRPWTS